jgi:DNA-binding transcriptional LysR family regulator
VKPQDLSRLPCVIDTNGRWLSNWPFVTEAGEPMTVPVVGRLEVNSPQAVRSAAIASLGYATMPDFIARPALDDGTLVSVLEEFVPSGGGIFAVYPHRRYLPAKVRVFVDYLVQWFRQYGAA